MAWTQICCQYDGTFSGFLCCVFSCYVNKEEPCDFLGPEELCCSLYPLRTIPTNEAQARRVYRSLRTKFGVDGQQAVSLCFLTCLQEKELWMWRFIRMGYERGPDIMRDLAHPTVHQVLKAVCFLKVEAHMFTGFVRFSQMEGLLAGEIEPKNQVLPLLRPHFCGRYPRETFVLYDRTHKQALFHRAGQWRILSVDDFQLSLADETELAFRQLWRSFYNTISIEGRYNPKCRQTHMPKRFWGCMTEFQTDASFPPSLPKNTDS